MATPSGDTSASSAPTSIQNSSTSFTSEPIIAEAESEAEGLAKVQTASVDDLTGFKVVADYLGIDTVDNGQRDKLQYIWETLGAGKERGEALEAIADVKHRLSPPDIGETYLNKMYSYVRLMGVAQDIEREKRAYESYN